MCWKVDECQYLHGQMFHDGRQAKRKGGPIFCHGAPGAVLKQDWAVWRVWTRWGSMTALWFWQGHLETAPGNIKVCRSYGTGLTLLQTRFCGFIIKAESLCCEEFSMGILSRYLYSDYLWLWLKIAKFCYGSSLWITTEVFACILMTPE